MVFEKSPSGNSVFNPAESVSQGHFTAIEMLEETFEHSNVYAHTHVLYTRVSARFSRLATVPKN